MKTERWARKVIVVAWFFVSLGAVLVLAQPVLAQEPQETVEATEPPAEENLAVPVPPAEAVAEPAEAEEAVPIGAAAEQDPSWSTSLDQLKWGGEIRKQSVETIQSYQKFDETLQEAASFQPISEAGPQGPEEEILPTMTDHEIIRSLLKPEFQDKRIDLDFDEIKIGDIIMTLAKTGNFNTVLDPALKNNQIDLHLTNVTIKEALMLLANAYNLGFKRVEDSLYITSRDNIIEQNRVSKVMKLTNISVAQAMNLVKDLAAKVSASEDINSIIVTGQPEEIVKIEEILTKIDKPQPQVILEAKIIELNKDALKDLGVDWSDQINVSYQESGRPVDFDDPENASKSVFEVARMQRNALQFDMVIKMLENQNKAKVLSTPRITTLNEKEAEIFVGDQIPYTITNVTGGVVTTEVQWVEPGIRLKITPSIIGEDFVVIKVEPEVSFIFTFRGPNDEYPQVKTREALAFVRVKDKQPFVIGGLLSQEDKINLYKVPFLGDVPLLGNLFSYEKHTVLDSELIITIVPTIVKSGS